MPSWGPRPDVIRERKEQSAEQMYEALTDLLTIIDGSDGVAGWHLNGDVAAWDEFEEVSRARQAVADADRDTTERDWNQILYEGDEL